MIAKQKKYKKGSWQTVFFPTLIGVLVLVIIGFLIFSNLKIIQKRAELTAKIEPLKEEIQILEEKIRELRAGITQTETETYWEERVREQGYKKPGEETVVVLPPEEENQESLEKEKSFWQKLLDPVRNFLSGSK